MSDRFLDMPPDEARKLMAEMGIDPEYFVAVEHDPNPAELNQARESLRALLDYRPLALVA